MTDKTYLPGQVTVVIPAYNEERFLREALDSVVHQVDCVLLGDNASTDGTEAICREYAAKYPHVKYFRHAENLGNMGNYVLLLDYVETEYFFSIGGHDIIPGNYVATLLQVMTNRSDVVAVYTDRQGIELDGSKTDHRSIFCRSLVDGCGMPFVESFQHDSPTIRMAAVMLHQYPDNFYHALFRTQELLPIMQQCDLMGNELFHINLLRQGKFGYSPDTLYYERNMHPHDTLEEYKLRCLGDKNKEKIAYSLSRSRLHEAYARLLKTTFIEVQDSHLSLSQKQQVFERVRRRMETGTIPSEVYRALGFSPMCSMWKNILRCIFDIRDKPSKTSYKFLSGPSFSIRKSKKAA